MTQSIISINNITKRYGDVTAVDNLTLDIQQGEVFGLLGHNGAGKTTTIRLLNGLLKPESGTIEVLGLDPLADGVKLRAQTGVLTETAALDETLTARETLSAFASLYGVPKSDIPQRVQGLLERFGLADRADDYAGGYSKGMRQRLVLARTMIHQPRLLFLDEPTSGLDPVAARAVHELIEELARQNGHTVLLCTHNLTEAQRLCDRVAVLEQGKLVALGAPRDLARDLHKDIAVTVALGSNDGANALQAAPDGTWDAQSNSLHITVQGREDIPTLTAELVGLGARIYSVQVAEATLEDVYFALHDAHQAEEVAA